MKWRGIAASTGIAIGRAYLLPTVEYIAIRQQLTADKIEQEISRLDKMVERAGQDISALKSESESSNKLEQVRIFDTHLSLLRDPEFIGEVTERIQSESLNAEAALSDVTEELIGFFSGMDNELLKERCIDLRDVSFRIWSHLSDVEISIQLEFSEPTIMIGTDITPSVTAKLDRNQVAGFALEIGGNTSHSAIIARSMGIPALVGVTGLTTGIQTGDLLIVDGYEGSIYLNPDSVTLEAFRKKQKKDDDRIRLLDKYKELPTVTVDGHTVQLAINIASPTEAEAIDKVGAEGIGLYRTEFLFMNRNEAPSEEEQFQAYKIAVVASSKKYPVVIRTLDVGGDKEIPYLQQQKEMNPFLGYRAIRLCLHIDYRGMFKTQLRAILRASAFGKVNLMYPMISTLQELRTANQLLADVKIELDTSGQQYDRDLEVGVMIEVPAAALISDQLAREVDFFSIGTNDLIQYTMAADRMNEKVAYLTQPLNPAVLRLVKQVIVAAHNNGKWVGMCGEMAGNPVAIPILIGLGLDEFSMSPSAVLPTRELISKLDYGQMRILAEHVLQMESAEEIEQYVVKLTSSNK